MVFIILMIERKKMIREMLIVFFAIFALCLYIYKLKNRMSSKYLIGKYVIVRSRAGIFAGTLCCIEEKNNVVIKNSRRLKYWDGAASLSELSQKGVSRPENCEFPAEIPTAEWLPDVIEVIECLPEAEKSIKAVEVWTNH